MTDKIIGAVLPLVIGFCLDLLLGDPHSLPHPIRWIGRLIAGLEKLLRKLLPKRERAAGVILAVTVLLVSTAVPAALLYVSGRAGLWAAVALESILCYYLLAAKSLRDESMKVYRAIEEGDLEKARQAVSMIVGRDTEDLDEKGIIKAAVETVAENTSDGVGAPLFYIMLGGAPAGFFYKAANTMDSMIGYKNDRYREFGKFAARLDDGLNFVPSRLTALFMILSAFLLGMDGKQAWKIWRRDRRNHESPNAAQTESACAGALSVMLAGDASYFGVVRKKKTIGDDHRPVENADICRANRLMYTTAALMLGAAAAVRAVLWGILL